MPAYAGPGKAKLLMANDQAYLFYGEERSSGVASVAYMLDRVTRNNHPLEFAVGLFFSAAPGAFEIDVQGAEIDSDASYVLLGTGITTVNAGNAARFSGVGYCPKFVRAFIVTAPSVVLNWTMILSR